jgi:hypothetical protein
MARRDEVWGRLDLVDDALLGGELLARGPEVGVVREELQLCAVCEGVAAARVEPRRRK